MFLLGRLVVPLGGLAVILRDPLAMPVDDAKIKLRVGIALIGLSLPRGKRSDEHYGGWDRYVV